MLLNAESAGASAKPRIVTLTLNPAADLECSAPSVRPTHKIRTTEQRFDPGGGGINVARALHVLGTEALALIMTGGVTGRLVEEMLSDAGVAWRSLPVSGRTRITLNVHDLQSGLEYRFVPEGPEVTEAEWRGALQILEGIDADWVVASGSLPPGVPADFYAQATRITARRGSLFVLDTSGAALRAAVGHGVALLKVSLSELEFLAGRELQSPDAQETEIDSLIRAGAAERITVSLGDAGAILAGRGAITRLPALAVQERSAVGAGDAFLAGLVSGLAHGATDREALALGIAAGGAAVSSNGVAHLRAEDVQAFYRKLLGLLPASS